MINMSGVGSTIQNIMDEEMRSCHLLRESALLCADSLQPTVMQQTVANDHVTDGFLHCAVVKCSVVSEERTASICT